MQKASIAVCLLCACCLSSCATTGGEDTSGIDPTGVYTLIAVNGSEVPTTVFHNGRDIKMYSGTMTVNADGTCISRIVFGSPSGAERTREVDATYTRNGSTLNMQWTGAGRTRATIKSDTLTMNNAGMILLYRR